MKYLFTLLFSLIGFAGFSQYSIYQTFEYPTDNYRANFYIDTVNCTNNLWQIGRPQKAVFDTAYSAPNVIVTDTLNEYPANDTSIFYLRTGGTYHAMVLSLSFYYQLDIDTLSTAKIEISGDRGLNWIDPIKEDTTYMFYWVGGKPRLDTSTTGWRVFNLNMDTWSYSYPGSGHTFPLYRTSDTLVYRFTFISGSDTVHHDGWMMDNFRVHNTGRVGIDDVAKMSTNISPNPSDGTIYLHPNFTTTINDRIAVYDMAGREVYTANAKPDQPIHLPLPNGIYVLKYYGANGTIIDRLVITGGGN